MQRIAANLELSSEPGEPAPLLPLFTHYRNNMLTDATLLHTRVGVVTDVFDHVFWSGDLNYRVDLERPTADAYLESSDWMVSSLGRSSAWCVVYLTHSSALTAPPPARSAD